MTFITDILAIVAIIYIRYFNVYQTDYIEGNLLVDPMKQIYVTTVVYGYILGLLNGCFLCRRFFPFNPKDVSVKNRVIRGIIGGILVILMLKYLISYIIMNIIPLRFAFPIMLVIGLFVTLIYPIIFEYFTPKKES
jgi:hypothetical protein